MTGPPPEPQARLPEPAPGEGPGNGNVVFGLALFGIFLLLFAGTVGVALVYLALD